MSRICALLLTGSLLLVPSPTWAQAGHSGDGNVLSVFGGPGDGQPLPPDVPASNPAGEKADPQRIGVDGDDTDLQITGIGFRGLSEVQVQIGDADLVTTRADETGTIAVTVPAPDAAAPGTSVVAIGRGPAGGARTITGAVPPQPVGANLMGWVRWGLLALAALGGLAAWQRARVTRRDLSGLPAPAGPPHADLPMPAPQGSPVALPPPFGRSVQYRPSASPAPPARAHVAAAGR